VANIKKQSLPPPQASDMTYTEEVPLRAPYNGGRLRMEVGNVIVHHKPATYLQHY